MRVLACQRGQNAGGITALRQDDIALVREDAPPKSKPAVGDCAFADFMLCKG